MDLNKVIQSMKDVHHNSIEYYDDKGKKAVKTFNELYMDTISISYKLDKLGLKSNDRVGFIARTCYEWVAIDLACIANGIMTVPFDQSKSHNTNKLIKEYELSFIFTNLKLTENGSQNIIDFSVLFNNEIRQYDSPFVSKAFDSEEAFTMIFSSGTGGREKAIEVRTKCFNDLLSNTHAMFSFRRYDKVLVFLPLHIYLERCYIYMAILLGMDILLTPFEYVFKAIRRECPTVTVGIPYFFESMYNLFLQEFETSALRSLYLNFFLFMKSIGLGFVLPKQFSPFRHFWGGKMRYLLSGSAPCQRKILSCYHKLGIPIYEGYGISEIAGLLTLNYPGNIKIGSAGKVFPNKRIELDANRQILIKGDYVANTIYYRASRDENDSVFLPDGWIATGDVGYFDKDNYLFINGRVKDILVLSNGKKVHPASIEDRINSSPLINNSVVVGDNRPYLVALLVPKDKSMSWQVLNKEIIKINKSLAPDENIKNFHILTEDFTPFNGLLTTAFKLNRKLIEKKYDREITWLY